MFLLQIIVADMRKVLAKNPQVEQQKLHRRVFLDNINPENQALLVSLNSWTIISYKFLYYLKKNLDIQVIFSFSAVKIRRPVISVT